MRPLRVRSDFFFFCFVLFSVFKLMVEALFHCTPYKGKYDSEEQLCIVKFVLCVGFADRVGIGEGVQVGKQVEPR